MPMYEYECSCGYEGEELTAPDAPLKCGKCGAKVERKMSRFASVIAGGSPVETIDMTVGRDADRRWKVYGDMQSKRRGDKVPQPVNQPKGPDGKFQPIMALGGEKDRTTRQEYSTALQEHRKDRESKGQAQFDGKGF